ncbi:MAG: SUMF1/EgtB/PvdO family nonheme iron enzyme [Bacteroidaceae bacterium]|nr:SUMF1/EgtB/PvdO family nonheme iron enzyme [Bacteroidaceae bacterium]
MQYDIFISYKRKSLATANNLYYRLTTRGYSVFFDLEEMRRDNFDVQLLKHIDEAKDVFVLLEEGSLDACKNPAWKEDDWFCHEVAYALEKGKNIIPLLLNGYEMPSTKTLPAELQELTKKDAPQFAFAFFDSYLDKLIEKEYITASPQNDQKVTSIFKFYSNENCQIMKDGKLVCSLEGNSDEPFYLPIVRKGSYRFKCINSITLEEQVLKESIDFDEEKEVEIEWTNERKPFTPKQEFPSEQRIFGDEYDVELGHLRIKMIRVEGGTICIGATKEQLPDADANEYPEHTITLQSFYISQFPITQNVWEVVMGYNKSKFKELERAMFNRVSNLFRAGVGSAGGLLKGGTVGAIVGGVKGYRYKYSEKGHFPAENLTHDEAQEFVRRLSEMTNLQFSLPSEDEWEYAARGGQKSKGNKFAGSNNIDDVAWYRGNSDECTHPVGEKQPNELGLYDMSGNVWEWTETPAHSYSYNSDNISGNVYIRRGGSWWHEPTNCRVSKRYASDKSKKTSGLGLRVVIRIK